MQPDYWIERWQRGQIGFHQAEVNRLLERHWPALALPQGCTVLVPLCGKSLDMAWLAARGHRVLGVELVERACIEFFEEHGLVPERHAQARHVRYHAGGITLLAGDAFALDDADLADCRAVYDRGALIALPQDLRTRYVRTLYDRLPTGCEGLLVTLDYPPHERAGPPFAVDADEVARLFAPDWSPALLDSRDILWREPGFQAEGVTRLATEAWRLGPHIPAAQRPASPDAA